MRVAALVVVAVVGLAGCASKEERLADVKAQRRDAVDALYTRYGGGALAAEVSQEARAGADRAAASSEQGKGVAREFLASLANAAGEVDRAAFEEQCLVLGRGERPVVLNDKAKAFFATDDAQSACRRIALFDDEAAQLERALGRPAP